MEIYPIGDWNKSRDERIDLYQITQFNLRSKFKNSSSLRVILSSKIISWSTDEYRLAIWYKCGDISFRKMHQFIDVSPNLMMTNSSSRDSFGSQVSIYSNASTNKTVAGQQNMIRLTPEQKVET